MTVNHPSTSSRGRTPRVLVAAALVLALAAAFFVLRQDNPASQPPAPAPQPPPATAPPTTLDPEKEVVTRLQEILRVRDEAYRKRDLSMLEEVYTSDCPCLRGDSDAIRQLRNDHTVWVGATTSVRVQTVERVNDRVYIVTGLFVGSSFRIKKETGELIRAVQGRSQRFRFALARPMRSDDWLLGNASPFGEG